jgi:hypothetical protein
MVKFQKNGINVPIYIPNNAGIYSGIRMELKAGVSP